MDVSIDFLGECFQYQPESGLLFWKQRPASHFRSRKDADTWNLRYAGAKAGSEMNRGYLMVQVRYRGTKIGLLVHRIAWALEKRRWPIGIVDHVNRARKDNRIANLREATSEESSWNAKRKAGTHPVGVVGPKKGCRKFYARIKVSGKFVHLGSFETAEAAGCAYQQAATSMRGAFHLNSA